MSSVSISYSPSGCKFNQLSGQKDNDNDDRLFRKKGVTPIFEKNKII
jgi:hypothetical protein